VPAALLDAVQGMRSRAPQEGNLTRAATLPRARDGADETWLIVYNLQSDSFVAWRLLTVELRRRTEAHLMTFKLSNDSLRVDLVTRNDLNWQAGTESSLETLGFAPAHPALFPDGYVALRIDTGRQFMKDDELLSTLFIVIAVRCVPIVASATLMVVHMILREASEARKKVDFVSNVTHELKTPLTSIRMFVETLALGRAKDDQQRQACLDVIMSETERLGALIDHVLSFSKVENQVKKYNMQPNNIAQVVRDTVSLFKAQMTNVQGEIRLKILPGLPNLAVFDKDALREVLLNLLSNAIKYGGAEKFVTVQVGVDQNDLFVEVADRGIGIPQDDLARIFEKFYRVDQELSRNVDGTGLGLAICKEIVQAHGGRIAVSSVLRKGSTFTVFLPYRVPKAGQKRATATQVVPARRDTQPIASEPV
jgi:signal transduction histidine kinase